ncbi:hypothetical protein [Herbidospora sp. RD11066]
MRLSGEDYLELLPVEWRAINEYGIQIGCRELRPYRRQSSGIELKAGLWEVHHDPYDLSHVWVRDHRAGGWITVPWTRRNVVSGPFADFTWRHACSILASRGADDTDENPIAVVVEDLLSRVGKGPGQRIIARTRAVSALPLRPDHQPPAEDSDELQAEQADLGQVAPFGVFDAFTEGSR